MERGAPRKEGKNSRCEFSLWGKLRVSPLLPTAGSKGIGERAGPVEPIPQSTPAPEPTCRNGWPKKTTPLRKRAFHLKPAHRRSPPDASRASGQNCNSIWPLPACEPFDCHHESASEVDQGGASPTSGPESEATGRSAFHSELEPQASGFYFGPTRCAVTVACCVLTGCLHIRPNPTDCLNSREFASLHINHLARGR